MAASSAPIPCSASSTTTATSARSRLLRAMITESFSAIAVVLPLRRIPAVSMMRKICPGVSSRISTESRVVPATGETMARSSPRKRFSKEDLPAFGRPTIASRSSRSGSALASGFVSETGVAGLSLTGCRNSTVSESSISPKPFPCSAEIAKTSAKPKL